MNITEAAPLEYKTFKLGLEGWFVIAAQDAINSHFKEAPLALDGKYGPASDKAGRELQAACKVRVDGVLGPITQEAFCRAKMVHAEKGISPPGLLIGICKMESSYQWACVSIKNPQDESYDVGVTQVNIKPSEWKEPTLLGAFNPDGAGHVLAGETLGYHNAFVARVGDRRAWELAALAHNWPVAAYAIAEGRESWLDKPFAFTTARGYTTALEYVNHYIAETTAQVTTW